MGRPEVRHYKAIPFADIHFDGGAIGVEIGHSGFMGSENLFLDCHWLSCSTAGLLTSNPNALQQSVIGGNFQGCNRAIFAGAGSVRRSMASASKRLRIATSTPARFRTTP